MMRDRCVMQEALFYGFSMERHVPSDHLLRKIDRFVDLTEFGRILIPTTAMSGVPSVDPELMMRTLIIGCRFGVRSELLTSTMALLAARLSRYPKVYVESFETHAPSALRRHSICFEMRSDSCDAISTIPRDTGPATLRFRETVIFGSKHAPARRPERSTGRSFSANASFRPSC